MLRKIAFVLVISPLLVGINITDIGPINPRCSSTTAPSENVDDFYDHKFVYEYYGEAEQEINSGSFDKNLWARALVEAGGDEAKRKAKYIELRANQLYIENGGSLSAISIYEQPTTSACSSNIDLTGTYVSEIAESGVSTVFQKKYRKTEIWLWQKGNAVRGTDSSRTFEIDGTCEGRTIKFDTYGGYEIDGVWEINSDATMLEGQWHTNGGASGKWNLRKME